ncbi:MAG TPA: NTP transferase domain-containing protein [Minicystis sp.]|nr:NTP transferase domain-containing protein [Minicystis sp.]
MTARPVTVVLAAGKGTRLGGPKALLAWPEAGSRPGREVPLAIAHAEARLAAESERVLLVVRQPVATALLGYVRPGIDLLVSHADDEDGPAGSLAAAAERLPTAGDALVIVTPVDTPPAAPGIVAALVARLASDPELLAARPLYEGRFGHPVVVRAPLLARFRVKKPPPLREVLGEIGPLAAAVPVDDARVRADLDTPADVVRATGAAPKFVG